MPFTQLSTDFGGRFTAAAGAAVGDDISKALQRYEDDKKKREFNDGVFDALKDEKDSEGNPYISPDALQRWNSINPDKQAGILSAAGAKIQDDRKRKREQMQIDAANRTSPFAGTHVYDDSGTDVGMYDERGSIHYYPSAGGKERLDLTDEEKAAAKQAGKVPLRQSGGSFQYAEDPNSPINMGVQAPRAIPDPRDPTKIVGMQEPGGRLKYFPKSSTMQELVDMGYITAPQASAMKVQPNPTAAPSVPASPAPSAPPATATVNVASPADAAALPPGTRYKTPDGRVFIR